MSSGKVLLLGLLLLTLLVTDTICLCEDVSLGLSDLTRLIPDSAITASESFPANINETNQSKPYYARLNSKQAFCHAVKNDFYLQVDFGKRKTISAVREQLWTPSTSNFVLLAYALAFSLDGVSWFMYNKDANLDSRWYQPVLNQEKTREIALFRRVMARYVRFFPLLPTSTETVSICMRLDFVGCDQAEPPAVKTESHSMNGINSTVTLECSVQSQPGVRVSWSADEAMVPTGAEVGAFSNSFINKELTHVQKFAPDIQSVLASYTCVSHATSFACWKLFYCVAVYGFDLSVRGQSSKNVTIVINLPANPTISVVNKSQNSATIVWTVSEFNDIPRHLLEARLGCNQTGSFDRETYRLDSANQSRELAGLDLYTTYQCQLRLLFSDRNLAPKLGSRKVIKTFRTLGLQPTCFPMLIVVYLSPTSLKVTCRVKFTNPLFGVVTGYAIQAKHISYGKKSLVRTGIQPNTKFATLFGEVADFDFNGLTPWSEYKFSCAAFNEDNLLSNSTVLLVETPIGRPSKAPSIRLYLQNTRAIVIEVDFDEKFSNGPIKLFRAVMNPGNVVLEVEHLRPQFNGLKPYTNYSFYVQAATSEGFGPSSDVLYVLTGESEPGPPEQLSYVPISHQNLFLRWSEPGEANGLIVKYEVRLFMQNNSVVLLDVDPKSISLCETNVPKSLVRKVEVIAVTSQGHKSRSPAVLLDLNADVGSAGISNTPVIVMTVFIVVLLLVIFAIFVMYLRRKRSERFRDSSTANETVAIMEHPSRLEDDEGDDCVFPEGSVSSKGRSDSVEPVAVKTKDAIPVAGFADYVTRLKQEDWLTLANEFKQELLGGKRHPWTVGDKPENRNKNRYTDAVAYDHSRVLLKHDCKRRTSDYINASYIQGYNPTSKEMYRYIATQGPLENVVNDFWLMVWQEDIDIIIMLTNLVENEKPKCYRYWPSEGSAKFGNITVTRTSDDKTADYLIRTFNLAKDGDETERVVRQFHFVSWPDHGAPEHPTALLSLRRRVRHYMVGSKPVLVHCSAGIGRTGCYVLIDSMLERIDVEGTVDIFNYTQYLRTRRIDMVQSLEQYKFAHNAIVEYITFGNTEISRQIVHELDKRIRRLEGNSSISDEFEVLQRNTARESHEGNVYKVRLKSGKVLEAFEVDGYKHRNAFILMQAPVEEQIADFWQMIFEKGCHTIVMLNRCRENDKEYIKYWPEVDTFSSYGDLSVLLSSEVTNGSIVTRKLKVNSPMVATECGDEVVYAQRKLEVQHFQYLDWPVGDVPAKELAYVCTLMQAVQNSQQNLGNGPILVHDGDSFGRSGTFVAMYNSTERLKVEQLIDVLQCVRSIRIAQPASVGSLELYGFIYKMIRAYLEAFDRYWNFRDSENGVPC